MALHARRENTAIMGTRQSKVLSKEMRHFIVFLLCVATIYSLIHFFQIQLPQILICQGRQQAVNFPIDTHTSVQNLSPLERLSQLNSQYDQQSDINETGLDLGVDISFESYLEGIKYATEHAFASQESGNRSLPSVVQYQLHRARAQFLQGPSGSSLTRTSIPKIISTTVSNASNLSTPMESWEKLYPNWNLLSFDHSAMDDWMEGRLRIQDRRSKKDEMRIVTAYRSLPRGILKTELFRYLLVLVKGGLLVSSRSPHSPRSSTKSRQ